MWIPLKGFPGQSHFHAPYMEREDFLEPIDGTSPLDAKFHFPGVLQQQNLQPVRELFCWPAGLFLQELINGEIVVSTYYLARPSRRVTSGVVRSTGLCDKHIPKCATSGQSFPFAKRTQRCCWRDVISISRWNVALWSSSAASLEDPLSTASLDGKYWDKPAKDITIATYKRLCIRSCRVLIRWQNKPRFFFFFFKTPRSEDPGQYLWKPSRVWKGNIFRRSMKTKNGSREQYFSRPLLQCNM